MKANKTTVLIIGVVVLFVGMLMVVTIGSKDSQKHQTRRALDAFQASLPADVLKAFTAKDYPQATALLSGYTSKVREYANLFPVEKRINFLKAEYNLLDAKTLEKIPTEIRKFWKNYYAVLDEECIQGFSDADVIDFYKVYRVETLEKMKAGTYKEYLN